MFARMNDQVSGNGTSKARRIKNFGWEGIGESLVLNCQNNFFMKGPWSQRAAYLSSFFEPQPFSLDDISAFYDTTNDLCYLAMSDPSVVEFIKEGNYDLAIATDYEFCPFLLFDIAKIPSVVCKWVWIRNFPPLELEEISTCHSIHTSESVFRILKLKLMKSK